MTTLALRHFAASLSAAILLASPSAHAELFRAYLSSTGSDANPCTLPAPCRLLPAALSAVASGGEIWMLDSANYNTATVNIAKSVSILAVPGAVGSVLAIGGPAILVNSAGLKVSLRNLVIAPLAGAGGTYGIWMTHSSTLVIDGCLLADHSTHGVSVSGSGTLLVTDSLFRGNAGMAVNLENGSKANISRTRMLGNVAGGVHLFTYVESATTAATVTDSVITASSGASSVGVAAITTTSTGKSQINVYRTSISSLDTGVYAATTGVGSATITLGGSSVSLVNTAWHRLNTGALIRTFGNNQFSDYSATIGALTPVSQQ